MRKLQAIIAATSICFLLVGCGESKIDYVENIGYKTNQIHAKDVVVKIYQANSETDDTWKLVSTDTIPMDKFDENKVFNVRGLFHPELKKNIIELVQSDPNETGPIDTSNEPILQHVVLTDQPVTFSTSDALTLKDIPQEQPIRAFCVPKDGSSKCTFFTTYDPKEKIDTDHANKENFLVTLEFVK